MHRGDAQRSLESASGWGLTTKAGEDGMSGGGTTENAEPDTGRRNRNGGVGTMQIGMHMRARTAGRSEATWTG